jgi:hypothetical protein
MRVMEDIRSWWAGHARREDVEAMDVTGREALARDLGLDRDRLERIAARGPQAGRELHRMLAALRLDPQAVKMREPLLMRDMSATCSTCLAVRACRRHLDRGVARAVYQHICPNAASLALLEAQDWWGAHDPAGR